jgi:hypothetical protein
MNFHSLYKTGSLKAIPNIIELNTFSEDLAIISIVE